LFKKKSFLLRIFFLLTNFAENFDNYE